MDEMMMTYWVNFKRIGKEKLSQYGYTLHLLPKREKSPSTFLLALTKDKDSYILSFSTYHLDH